MTTRIPILAGLLTTLLGVAPGSAQTASLVADLVTSEGAAIGSSPEKLTPVRGGRIVFEAGEDTRGFETAAASSGRELWGSDGTAEGTVLLADLCPGPCSSRLKFHGTLDGVALFSDAIFGQMWRTDGTREGTFLLLDPGGEPLEGVYLDDSALFGGFVYFDACGKAQGCGLWRTDGTPAGTRLVASQARLGGEAFRFAATDQVLFFAISRPDFTSALLWRTDGTAAGTVRLAAFRDPLSPLPKSLTPVGSKLFFTGPGLNGQELWVSDGTRAGTRPLTNFRPPLPFGGGRSSLIAEPLLFADEGRIDFAAYDGVHGWELWQSDGTPEGTRQLTEIALGYPFVADLPIPLVRVGERLLVPVLSTDNRWSLWSSNGRTMIRLHTCVGGCSRGFSGPPGLVVHGGQALFTAGARLGQELWSTDGTVAGTRKLVDACTGDCHSVIGLTSVSLGGLAVFKISEHGKDQLWGTDGTAAGTRPLFHLPPGTSTGALPVAVGSKIFFGATNEDGMELWVSEGGEERQVANLASEAASSWPIELVAVGSHLLFQTVLLAPLPENRTGDLWQSEGTEATTSHLLHPFRLTAECYHDGCAAPRASADGWLATVNTPRDGVSELWRTDGTSAGTARLFTVEAPGRIEHLAAFRDIVVFFVESPHHLEIWRSDGTPAGTFQVAHKAGRLRVGGVGGTGTEVYFELGGRGTLDLWRSDGTAEGTVRVAGLPSGPGRDILETVPIRVGDRVCFAIYAGQDSQELWSTDGTEAGTFKLIEAERISAERQVLDGKLYFPAFRVATFGDLWRSDGTVAGPVLVGGFGAMPTSLTIFAGRLFFATNEAFAGRLWSSNGTRAGTRLVVDFIPDVGLDGPSIAVFGNRLYFSAFDPEHGFELWQSDGTAGGTRMVQDLVPGVPSSSPNQLTVAGDRLYFTAADDATGRELWSLGRTQ